jgi:hypothetical protein
MKTENISTKKGARVPRKGEKLWTVETFSMKRETFITEKLKIRKSR